MRKKAEKVKTSARRPRVSTDSSYTVGRTIAGSSHRGRSEKLAREALHKRKRAKNTAIVLCVVLFFAAIGFATYSLVSDYQQQKEVERLLAERKALIPTVPVYDENAGGQISTRVNEFIVQAEQDVHDIGYEIDHVVLPLNKARQLIVFLKDRAEYYKLSIDRPSAVQVEDMGRMIHHLDAKQIKCSYVDLRIEGRAYYK